MKNFIDFTDYSVDGEKVCNDNGKRESKAVEVIQRKNQLDRLSNNYSGTVNSKIGSYAGGGIAAASGGPFGAVLGVISSLAGSIENIIVSFNEVRVEKERTKQIAKQAEVFITQAKEETKRTLIHEKEETNRLRAQLDNDYRKLKASLFQVAKEFELKNKELSESGRRFDLKLDIIKDTAKSLIEEINRNNKFLLSQWKQGKDVDEKLLRHVETLQSQSTQLMIELMKIS